MLMGTKAKIIGISEEEARKESADDEAAQQWAEIMSAIEADYYKYDMEEDPRLKERYARKIINKEYYMELRYGMDFPRPEAPAIPTMPKAPTAPSTLAPKVKTENEEEPWYI